MLCDFGIFASVENLLAHICQWSQVKVHVDPWNVIFNLCYQRLGKINKALVVNFKDSFSVN